MGDTGDKAATGTPRWVKVFGIIAAIVILLLIVVFLVQGGHGPSRHTGSLGGPVSTGIPGHGASLS